MPRPNLRILVIAVLFFPAIVVPQTVPEYLVGIDLRTGADLNVLEAISIPVLHRSENMLFTLLPTPSLRLLTDAGVHWSILDERDPGVTYILLSKRHKGDRAAFDLRGERPVYDDGTFAIARDRGAAGRDALWQQYQCVALMERPILFRNERLVLSPRMVGGNDSLVASIVSEVNQDTIRNIIQTLQDFQTRYARASNRGAVSAWIKSQFERFGYADVVFGTFSGGGYSQENVIATLPSGVPMDAVVVVGGHYDSNSGQPLVAAPGADDNASGTAAVLEIARVLKKRMVQPKATIKFVTFAAEEIGLIGSFDYAAKAASAGTKIKFMINHDMISTTNFPVGSSGVDINYYTGAENYRDVAIGNVRKFTKLTPYIGTPNSGGSDSYAFWSYGYPAVYFEERNFSPFYHSPADTIGNCHIDYCAEVIKASCATLVIGASMPSWVEGLTVKDRGNGNELLVAWSPVTDPDLQGYHIYRGNSSGVYDTVLTTTSTSFLLGGLVENVRYYVGVSAFNNAGYESYILEKTLVPRSVPLGVTITASPQWHRIELTWVPNQELDLLGYNVYRKDSLSGTPTRLNTAVVKDTVFRDSTATVGLYYFYAVRAEDSSHAESPLGAFVRSRVLSFDQGILVVDETKDGDGSPFNPTDGEVDSYFASVMAPFSFQNIDAATSGSVTLNDLGAFSSVVWHANDNSEFGVPGASTAAIRDYLANGGKLFYAGYRPSRAFGGNTLTNRTFGPGEFMYDVLKIQRAFNVAAARFAGADARDLGYPDVYVDSLKAGATNNYHLTSIETIFPNSQAQDIYWYDTYYDSTTTAGYLKGKPIGVEYLGNDYKAITLSVPLYYMKADQARNLLAYVLSGKFGEPTSVNEVVSVVPTSFSLDQNYPNPFNPSTTITYQLPENSFVTLKVYDLLGREVASLVNGGQVAGSYAVRYDCRGLASGMYLYRLQASPTPERSHGQASRGREYMATRKLLLLK